MIQKEQFKQSQSELEELLLELNIPHNIWHWPQVLILTLWLMGVFFLPGTEYRVKLKVHKAWELAREIYE